MLQRGPSTSVHPLIAILVGLALTACSDPARSQGAAAGTPSSSQDTETAEMPTGAPNPVVDTALNAYTALEYCDVDGDRLKGLKQKMKDLASQQQGMSSAQFDAAFEAGLPAARQATEANAAANPAEMEAGCEQARNAS